MNITPDIDVEKLVEDYPKAVNFLADRGIVCIRCGEPYWGSLRDLIDQIVEELRVYLSE